MNREEYLKNPLRTIDPDNKSISELLEAMADTAYQGRSLGEAYRILKKMVKEPNNTIFLSLAGSMSTAGMWKLIKWMIENRIVDVIVSTGANISEDIYESIGCKYYKGTPFVDDRDLLKHKIDRFYDVYADEFCYRKMEQLIADFIASIHSKICSTVEFLYAFGEYLEKKGIDCIVSAAYRSGVPVFSPTLIDSGYGIASLLALEKGHHIVIDMVRDFKQLVEIGRRSDKLSAIYVGGGVPKDYINLMIVMQTLLAESKELNDCYKSFNYAIQITTDSPQWGGLSGATLEEAISWGKISIDSARRTVYVDATIALPLLIQGLIDEGISRANFPDFSWLFLEFESMEVN